MGEIGIAILIFLCLSGASLGCLATYERLPAHHRHDETYNLVRVVANIFVVMTSLVLGLTINSAKNTFESIDYNVHAFATEMILLDRTLRRYGPETEPARQALLDYVKRVMSDGTLGAEPHAVADRTVEELLNAVGDRLDAITAPDAQKAALWQEARQHLQKVVELRWVLIGQSEGDLPRPLLIILVTWLVAIYASLGYRAPRNAVIVGTFVVSAALISASIYLILDMDAPFDGPIRVSPAPLERLFAEMQT
jgi:hypothetical protein